MNQPAFQRIDLPPTREEDRAIQRIAEATHRVNEAVQRAVELGLSVELVRVSRCHNGGGSYGDQVVPTIRDKTNDQ
ncbi:hypothetical protein [Pseudovibrio exalbescens]|uniref:Uncharacterized protein n=1 Tax=Pseudovibrio exalbescens TaxID=197461 RepID=A0A1U7JMC4_9HYPH|nr:hypothetical protein [Pseudovibrio exalbescens]OKL45854.1 hypothetical protein A3843_01070 [Pseudovibrio exalbescens]